MSCKLNWKIFCVLKLSRNQCKLISGLVQKNLCAMREYLCAYREPFCAHRECWCAHRETFTLKVILAVGRVPFYGKMNTTTGQKQLHSCDRIRANVVGPRPKKRRDALCFTHNLRENLKRTLKEPCITWAYTSSLQEPCKSYRNNIKNI